MTDRGLLIVFSGPSGVGKDTVLKEFFSVGRDCELSVSVTTRSPREGERDGVDYYFVSRDEFERMEQRGDLLEHAEFSGNFYGTPRRTVQGKLDAGITVILEIETKGAMQVRRLMPEAVFVFLMPPSMQALRERLELRGTETAQSLQTRLKTARTEMLTACEYDYIIVNRTPRESAEQLGAIIKAAGCAVKYRKELALEVLENA